MFSTKVLLFIIAGVVVAGGGVYVAVQSSARSDQESESMMSDTDGQMDAEAQASLSGAGTLRSLLALGKDLTCTFSYVPPEGGTTEGTVYLSGERMRGDFAMNMDGQRMESHVIRTGDKGYTWGVTPYGQMAVMFDTSTEADTPEAKNEEGVDLDQNLQYDCRRWSVDTSKFAPPADIEFHDMSANVQMMRSTNASVQGNQCAACAQVPDPSARAQCEAALGC